MKNILLTLLCTVLLLSSCVDEWYEHIEKDEQISFKIKTKELIEVKARSNAHENDMEDIYLIVFEQANNLFVECRPAKFISGNSYTAALTPTASKVKIVAVANVPSLIEAKKGNWVQGTTTYNQVAEDLLTNELALNGGMIVAMPEVPPMSGEMMLDKIDKTMTIPDPFLMERATAKITISTSVVDFNVIGANIYNAPTKGYVLPNQTSANLLGITRTNYAGSDRHGAYGSTYMISTATMSDPLYCYETIPHNDNTQNPYVIINTNRGYYRINLTDKDGTQLNLQRNFYYKINVSKVINDGATTPEEAQNNPPLVGEVEINDPDSYEIISNGIDYLGLSNSEYILYVSPIMNEFNSSGLQVFFGLDYDKFNGFNAATVTYKSRSSGTVTCIECVTESGSNSTVRFRDTNIGVWDPQTENPFTNWTNIKDNLILPASVNSVQSKKIIIVIPHDFVSAKLRVKVGALERDIIIKRNEIIPFYGEDINMGSGFSTASVDFEKSYIPPTVLNSSNPQFPEIKNYSNDNILGFSTSKSGSPVKSLIINNPSDELFIKVGSIGGDAKNLFTPYCLYPFVCSELYLTRQSNQSRVKVHITREAFQDGAKDSQGHGPIDANYTAAFWINNQRGERIIRVPGIFAEYSYWSARVVYGQDFIRLAYTDDTRTINDGRSTSGSAEDYVPDDTWETYIEQKYTNEQIPLDMLERGKMIYPKFRIALIGENPNPSKPRYGVVVFMIPFSKAAAGYGQTFRIFVRQGEEADYVFSPTEMYDGASRTFAQAFSPFNLTVSDPANHPGGAAFSDHKSMNGPGVFAKYPSQVGYLYRWGDDIAVHPTNASSSNPLTGYTYDYTTPYKEVCPDGYTLAKTDINNSAYQHSFESKDFNHTIRGLCADGLYDRNVPASGTYIDNGGETANYGQVFYNINTLASIFFPKPIIRQESYSDGLSWGNIEGLSGNEQGSVANANNSSVTNRDRLLPVRCVKKTP